MDYRMRMNWTGHILRMSDNKTVKQVFGWEPCSRRSRARPKKRWMDCVEEDLHRAGISRYGITTARQRVSLQETARDRSQWRELVAASTAGTSFVMTTDLTWPIMMITGYYFVVESTRSSADADNRHDAFSGQARSTNMVPFWVRCDFFAKHVTATTRHKSVGYWYVTFILAVCCSSDATGLYILRR